MSFFVRTQDRTKILEIEGINYDEKKTLRKTVQQNNVTSEVVEERHRLVVGNRVLGEYESKERCFEVIDDIQRTLETRGADSNLVYNMPAT